jgi:hypothetical protein
MKTGSCSDILFVEDEIWKWRMPDEYSVLAYYNGNAEEAHKVTTIIINSPVFDKIATNEQERIRKNMEFYSKAITKATETVEPIEAIEHVEDTEAIEATEEVKN